MQFMCHTGADAILPTFVVLGQIWGMLDDNKVSDYFKNLRLPPSNNLRPGASSPFLLSQFKFRSRAAALGRISRIAMLTESHY